MKIAGVFVIFSVALAVDKAAAFGALDGLGLLQGYYGALSALAPPPAPLPAPAPAPAPAIDPAYLAMLLAPPAPAPVPAPLPPPPSVALPAADPKCCCHSNCLSYIKPCIHAKLLNLKKKLIEKKLAHLLACCASFNSHLASPSPC